MSDAPPSSNPGFLHRINETPLRDLVRGRITRRFNLRRIVEQAGLPPRSSDLVLTVTKRTRLWRLEMSDVTAELAAHFRDGLDAGVSEDALIASFGDVKQAAKLIRRAKVRNRPWVWHATKRSAQAVIVLVLAYAAMWGVLMMRHPHPSVDYVAKLSEPVLAVPESDRAWPIYRKAWIENRIWDVMPYDLAVPTVSDRPREPLPGESGWEKVEAFLHEHAALIEAARVGSRKPGFGLAANFWWNYGKEDQLALNGPKARPPDRPNPSNRVEALAAESLTTVMLPSLSNIRLMARLLALDMWLAVAEHDGDRVADDYRAILGLARQSREQPFIINQYVAISIMGIANETLMRVLERAPAILNNDQLGALVCTSAGAAPLTHIDFSGERYSMLDAIQRLYTDNGKGDGSITYDGLRLLNRLWGPPASCTGLSPGQAEMLLAASFPTTILATASRREATEQTNRVFTLLEHDAERPLWEVLHHQSETEKALLHWQKSPRERVRYLPLIAVLPSLDGAGGSLEIARAWNETTQVVLALELYRRDHGGYPGTLAELSPRYLPTAPVDHSTGGPLRLKIVDGKPVVYGLGKDHVDNGGVGSLEKYEKWPFIPKTGDWVLYPPSPVEPLAASANKK